jgi:sigma-B regulation protein RsbU (phosphoserine phosphatase)
MQQQFVQRGVPYIPGVNVGVVYRPATYVSGDLFDVEAPRRAPRVSVFLADAVGHGVPAAMLTLFISRALPKIDTVGGRRPDHPARRGAEPPQPRVLRQSGPGTGSRPRSTR